MSDLFNPLYECVLHSGTGNRGIVRSAPLVLYAAFCVGLDVGWFQLYESAGLPPGTSPFLSLPVYSANSLVGANSDLFGDNGINLSGLSWVFSSDPVAYAPITDSPATITTIRYSYL